MLSQEQIQAYCKAHGVYCPYCRSNDIENRDFETDDNYVIYHVTCHDCGASWDDVHTLSDIIERVSPSPAALFKSNYRVVNTEIIDLPSWHEKVNKCKQTRISNK